VRFSLPLIVCCALALGSASTRATPLVGRDAADVKIAPESPANAAFRRGVQALLRNDLDLAGREFSAGADLDPASPAPLLGLADVNMRRGKPKDAQAWLDRALAVAPQAPEVHLGMGRLQVATGRLDDAEKSFRSAIGLNPTQAPAYLELGNLYLQRRQPRLAVDPFEKAVALRRDDPFTHYGLGVALAATGKSTEARAALLEAAKLDPKSVEPLRALARLDAEAKRYDDAMRTLDRAGKLQPDLVVLQLDRVDVLLAKGDLAGAKATLERILTKNQRQAAARYRLGEVLVTMNERRAAEREFAAVVEDDPRNAAAMNNLAWLLAERKADLDVALRHAKRAVELAPDSAEFADTLGWVHRARGDREAATKELERAATLAGGDSGLPLYHLSIVLAEKGERDKAAAALDRALALPLPPDVAAEARKRRKQG
jgi:tetratricopeptide (TPR) repeat protein